MTEERLLRFQVTYAGKTQLITLNLSSATIAELQSALEQAFHVPSHAQKLLLPKGRKINTTDRDALLVNQLQESGQDKNAISTMTKLLLIGSTSAVLSSLESAQSQRSAKEAAFRHYSTHKPQPVRSTVSTQDLLDKDRYRFHVIRPFGKEVEEWDKRNAMLERLTNDEAVRDLMVRHRFVVGVLTELHPLLQPTLLGLNKNAGEEISLRLLTDDLSGTRSYLEVRKVLLHELAHNRVSPHNDEFKTLNSLLNRQVLEYEQRHGIKTSSGPAGMEIGAWNPTGSDSDLVPRGHRLDGQGKLDRGSAGRSLEWTEEELVEMRREKVRMAAEERRRAELGHE